jgi:hypothetical protein
VNVMLFFCVMQEFKKCFQISFSWITDAFLVLSFGLASPNFVLSLNGQIWGSAQILATTYLLLFYLWYFRFLHSQKPSALILCVVFFWLACLSRYVLLFNGILFIYLFWYSNRSGRVLPTRIMLSLVLLTLAFVSLEALYNFLRFHNVLETGLRLHIGAAHYNAIMKSNHILSVQYMPRNFYYCFINVIRFSFDELPFFVDHNGNSIFSVYPALLLFPALLFAMRKEVEKKKRSFFLCAGGVICLGVLLLLLYFATGWNQFGYRYFFDVIPLVFLLLIFILPSIPISIQMVLLGYGLFVNVCGIMAFFDLSHLG